MLHGLIDLFEESKVFGWAFDENAPSEHLRIVVQAGEKEVAVGLANVFRKDLSGAGVGDGDHAFEVMLPNGIKSLRGVKVIAESSSKERLELELVTEYDRKLKGAISDLTESLNQTFGDFSNSLGEARNQAEQIKADFANELASLSTKIAEIEARLDESEIFYVRIDQKLNLLVSELANRRRRRFLGIF